MAEAIEALRVELGAAADAAKGKDLRFEVGRVNVELEVVSERVTQGSGGLKFWVVELGAQRSRSDGRTHRVTVELTPQSGSGPLYTGDSEIPE